jgi:hypothetical protein
MRKVTFLPILIFQALIALPLGVAVLVACALNDRVAGVPLGGVIQALLVVIAFLAMTVLVYRSYLRIWPLPEGELPVGSQGEFRYLVYIMFWLMIFLPILRLSIIPVPLSRLVLIALGARVGEGTYSSGLVFDPHFVSIGTDTQLGIDCLLIPHAQAAGMLAHYPIRIGDRVTIGGRSVIMAGATIGDGAVVGFCSLVTRDTHIGPNEIWAGVPARFIRKI